MAKKALLMILDGWGIGKHGKGDVIFNTPTPYLDLLTATSAHAQLAASGEDVGLPDGQMGNSEVGHLNIGAGRIVYQDLVKINRACKDGSIMDNAQVKAAYTYAKEHNKKLHLMGLTSDGGVHSSLDHLFKLLDEEELYNYNKVRARTILLLFYETGIRLAELVGLNDEDVDFAAMQLKVTGKRDKQRIVPFGEELAQMLTDYITLRDNEVNRQSPALFLNGKGARITRGQVQNLVRKHLSEVTTLKKKSPHVLRHSFATAMLNNGAGLESVKKLLGHESLETTEIYTHTTFEQLKRIYNEAHPRA